MTHLTGQDVEDETGTINMDGVPSDLPCPVSNHGVPGIGVDIASGKIAGRNVKPEPVTGNKRVGRIGDRNLKVIDFAWDHQLWTLESIAVSATQHSVGNVQGVAGRVVGIWRVFVDEFDGKVGVRC